MPKQTLKEIALEMGFSESALERENWVMLDERFAVIADEKGLHLTDLVSWARFAPIKIGRKSSITRKGLEFQIAQLKQYLKQIGQVSA
jgi:DnaJ-domain-containing protein 1